MGNKFRVKEPGSWGFWLLVSALLLLCVPYLFVLFLDVAEPRLFGIPAWFYVTVASAILISVVSVVRIVKHWDIENKLP